MGNIKLTDRNLDFHPGIVYATQNLCHATNRRGIAGGGVYYLNHYNLTRLSACRIAPTYNNVVLDSLILGYYQSDSPLLHKPTHEAAYCMLKHLNNDSLRAASSVCTHHLGSNTIAMHGLEHFSRRNKNIVAASIGAKKTESITMAD
jgi:hypothetical protein